jgi:predicted metal-dependent phosphoesterase TrpH
MTPDTQPARPGRSSIEHIRVDLHVHTCYSHDCLLSLEDLIAAAQRRGLAALAVLDHNEIEGALALKEMAPFPVVVGEEIYTSEGEVAGLFLQERVPPGLPLEEAVARVKAQGGLLYIPHPFDRHRSSALGEPSLLRILDQVDALEVLNARALYAADNEKAMRFAASHGIPGGAGSDGHTTGEIGQAYVEMEPFADRDDFLLSLSRSRIGGGISSPHVHLYTTWAKIRKRIGD